MVACIFFNFGAGASSCVLDAPLFRVDRRVDDGAGDSERGGAGEGADGETKNVGFRSLSRMSLRTPHWDRRKDHQGRRRPEDSPWHHHRQCWPDPLIHCESRLRRSPAGVRRMVHELQLEQQINTEGKYSCVPRTFWWSHPNTVQLPCGWGFPLWCVGTRGGLPWNEFKVSSNTKQRRSNTDGFCLALLGYANNARRTHL